MITEKNITEAYLFLREKNQSIPSETLDFMKTASIKKLRKQESDQKEYKRSREDSLYSFFTRELYKLDAELAENSSKLSKLTKRQKDLKTGRTELVKLRREIKKQN